MRVLTLALAVACLVPASAGAVAPDELPPDARGNTPRENAQIASVMPLARVLWGAYECRGREVVIVLRGRGFSAAHEGSCRIWLDAWTLRSWARVMLCDVLSHEVGHLALTGNNEAADHANPINGGIMSASPGTGVGICKLA